MNFSRRVLFHRETTVCMKYFGHNRLHKQYFASNWPRDRFKFGYFSNFGNSKDFNKVLT